MDQPQENENNNLPQQEQPQVNAPVAEAPVVDASVADTSVADTSVADAPVADAPVADAPVADAPVADAPVADAPVADAPVTDAPVAEMLVDNAQVDNAQVDNAQVDNAQVDNAQVDNAQVDNAPTADVSTADVPVADIHQETMHVEEKQNDNNLSDVFHDSEFKNVEMTEVVSNGTWMEDVKEKSGIDFVKFEANFLKSKREKSSIDVTTLQIVDTNIEKDQMQDFMEHVYSHILSYKTSLGIGSVEKKLAINTEYKHMLMSKHINMLEYVHSEWKWTDVYDLDFASYEIRNKENITVSDTFRETLKTHLDYSNDCYVSKYVFVRLRNDTYNLFVIIGKRNIVTSQLYNLFAKQAAEAFDTTTSNLITTIASVKSNMVAKFINQHKIVLNNLNTFKTSSEKVQSELSAQIEQNKNENNKDIAAMSANLNKLVARVNDNKVQNDELLNGLKDLQSKSIEDFKNELLSVSQLSEQNNANQTNALAQMREMQDQVTDELRAGIANHDEKLSQINIELKTKVDELEKTLAEQSIVINQQKETFGNLISALQSTLEDLCGKLEEVVTVAFPNGKSVIKV
jgi:hypothetical protein